MSNPGKEVKTLGTLDDVIEAVVDIDGVVEDLSEALLEMSTGYNALIVDVADLTRKVEGVKSFERKDQVELDLKEAQTRKTCAETKKLEKEIEESPEAVRMFKRVLGIGAFVAMTLFGLGAISDAMKD